MSILRHLKPVGKEHLEQSIEPTEDNLPNLNGPLSSDIPPAAIALANDLVRESLKSTTKQKTRGPYHKLTAEMRANIGRYACENGVAAAARHFFRCKDLGKPINESTI